MPAFGLSEGPSPIPSSAVAPSSCGDLVVLVVDHPMMFLGRMGGAVYMQGSRS